MTEPKRAPGGFPVVGVVGGGQLARMMQGPAIELGVQLSVLAEDEVASAALVVPSSPVGRHTELDHVLDFARSCDVVTFDHEHVPQQVLLALEAEGIVMHPSRAALRFAQDKLAMRARLTELGIACPRWAVARDAAEVEWFGEEVGWPVVVKTPRGGYDGKGVILASSSEDAEGWLAHVGEPGPMSDGLLLEERVDFTRELAALVARSPSGQAAAWTVVETVQTEGVCTEVLAPAPDLDPDLASVATEAALRIAGELDVTGVLAVEMFEVQRADGHLEYVVNELAMRPHNSGHWSMDGAVTGQFEQHLRAVLDLPLGDPRPQGPVDRHGQRPRWRLPRPVPRLSARHGQGPRRPRSTCTAREFAPVASSATSTSAGRDLADARERARHAADYLQGLITE